MSDLRGVATTFHLLEQSSCSQPFPFMFYTTVTDFLIRIFAAQLHVHVLRSTFN